MPDYSTEQFRAQAELQSFITVYLGQAMARGGVMDAKSLANNIGLIFCLAVEVDSDWVKQAARQAWLEAGVGEMQYQGMVHEARAVINDMHRRPLATVDSVHLGRGVVK